MPAWIAALSPDTVMIAIAATGGVIALLLLVASVRRLRDWRIASGVVFLVLAAAVAALGTAGAMLAASLHTYARLSQEQEAARAVFRELTPKRYEMLLVLKGEPARVFEIRGDEWQIDARVLKWKGMGTLLGLDTLYRFERLAGRYADTGQEKSAARTVYPLAAQAPFDLWSLLNEHQRWLPLADALYGNAAYAPMADGAQYSINVSTTGLLIRPLNEPAKKALGGWK
jgi:hypothetical protein